MHVAVLSPHRDDAAFSCGLTMCALLQAGARISVVNVFTRSDYAVDLRTIDATLPQVDGVSHARLLEDQQFLADIAAAAGRDPECVALHDLGWLDAPLRLDIQTERVLESPMTDADVQRQAAQLAAELPAMQPYDYVFAPLALGDHIDHRIVREAAKLAVTPDHLCLYEDLPYTARLIPTQRKEDAFRATRSNSGADFARYALHLKRGPHLKTRFALHYRSQIAPEVAEEMALYAAELSEGDAGAERWWTTAEAALRIAEVFRCVPGICSLVEEQQ